MNTKNLDDIAHILKMINRPANGNEHLDQIFNMFSNITNIAAEREKQRRQNQSGTENPPANAEIAGPGLLVFAMPGFAAEHLNVSAEDRTLTIHGARTTPEGRNVSVTKKINVARNVDMERIDISLNNGEMVVTLPERIPVKRTFEVNSGTAATGACENHETRTANGEECCGGQTGCQDA